MLTLAVKCWEFQLMAVLRPILRPDLSIQCLSNLSSLWQNMTWSGDKIEKKKINCRNYDLKWIYYDRN